MNLLSILKGQKVYRLDLYIKNNFIYNIYDIDVKP